jgi:uncharacterized protein with PIN domain
MSIKPEKHLAEQFILPLSEVKDKTIIDGTEKMPLTKAQLRQVRHLVYYCPECKAYHFWGGNDFRDVEAVLIPK